MNRMTRYCLCSATYAVVNACKAIFTRILQQDLNIKTSREYSALQHRPQLKSYKENQLGDIIDAMKTQPGPHDSAGQAAWIDRCTWGGVLPALDAILCKLWADLSYPCYCLMTLLLLITNIFLNACSGDRWWSKGGHKADHRPEQHVLLRVVLQRLREQLRCLWMCGLPTSIRNSQLPARDDGMSQLCIHEEQAPHRRVPKLHRCAAHGCYTMPHSPYSLAIVHQRPDR